MPSTYLLLCYWQCGFGGTNSSVLSCPVNVWYVAFSDWSKPEQQFSLLRLSHGMILSKLSLFDNSANVKKKQCSYFSTLYMRRLSVSRFLFCWYGSCHGKLITKYIYCQQTVLLLIALNVPSSLLLTQLIWRYKFL